MIDDSKGQGAYVKVEGNYVLMGIHCIAKGIMGASKYIPNLFLIIGPI